MTLHSLILHGFKSFPDRTRIHFLHPVSAIVGPNGCGKSNLVDAMRWVLGESSSASVRGSKMADVIFSGSGDRSARTHASVELLLHNKNQLFSGAFANYQEISVSRHVHADGKSNYQINGAKVKKKDIVDLFAGTGLGHNSYSIIEQGIVSQLVTSKPSELKGYIEEVAGVSQFHARRQETVNRLEKTQKNVTRLRDMIRTLETQAKHLATQAQAAIEYSRIKKELAHLERILIAQEYQQLLNKQTRTEKAHVRYHDLHQTSLATQAQLELRINEQHTLLSTYKDRLHQVEKQWQDTNFRINMLDEKIQWHQTEQAQNVRKQEELLAQKTRIQQAKKDIEEQRQKLQTQQHNTEQQDAHKWQQLEQENNDAASAHQQWRVVAYGELQSYKEQVVLCERTHKERQLLQSECATLKTQYEQASGKNNDNEIDTHIQTAKQRKQDCLAALQLLATKRTRLQQIINTHTQKRQRQQAQLATNHKQLQELANEQRVLEKLIAAKSATQNTAHATGEMMQEHIVVLPEWSQAFDMLFKEHWYLLSMQDDTQSTSHVYQTPNQSHQKNAHPLLQPLTSCLVNNFPLPSFCALGYVLQDESHLAQARTALHTGEWILLRSGDRIGYDWRRHEHNTSEGIVQLRSKKEQVDTHYDAQQKEHAQLAATHALFKHQSVRLQNYFTHYGEEKKAQESQLVEQEKHLHRLQITLENNQKTAQHAQWLANQLAQKNIRLLELDTLYDEIKNSQQKYEQHKQIIDQQAKQKESALKEKQEQCQTMKLIWYRQQDEQKNIQQRLSMLQERSEDMQTQERTCETQLAQIQEYEAIDLNALQQEQEQLRRQAAAQQQQKKNSAQEQQAAQQSMDELQKNLAQATEQERVHDIEMHKQSALLEAITPLIEEQLAILETHNMLPEEACSIAQDAAQQNISHKKQHTQMQQALDAMGAVNLLAEREGAQCNERLQDTQRQHDEIMQAVHNLEQAIGDIEQEANRRLNNTVARINEQLVVIYDTMFQGGRCELRAADDATGIEIHSQLPGKKQFALKLLSGGERALVAITFIFALFSLNPAPFCVFDEVDAPLDDANVTALGKMIAAYKDRVQFVVVTHNKLMMAKTDTLIGVTMSESGISRVVPVNIEQALAWKNAYIYQWK